MAGFERITLEKGMYAVPGKSFTQVLEELDSSENYRGTALEGLDAYQRQLMRFGIRVSGPDSDTVEHFFGTAGSAALFPEYVARAVRQGMDKASRVEELVAAVTHIDGLDYRTVNAQENGNASAARVAEGAQLPETHIRLGKGLVQLKKRGRMLVSSYEALRFMKLDLFSVALRQIGAAIANAQMLDAVDALVSGDGTQPGVVFDSGTPDYSDLVKLWGELAPFRLNVLVGGTGAMQQLLGIAEFKDPQAGMNFQGTGRLVTPLGAKLIHVPGMADKKLLALDRDCALEMVQAGEGICTDSDRLIDRQLERASISSVAGFARIYAGAARGLQYS